MEIIKNLGQSAPLASTDTDVYTVPSNTSAVISTLWVHNGGASESTITILHRVNGEANSAKQRLAYDVVVPAKTIVPFTNGITMGENDVITVNTSTADFSINIYGSEVS